MGYRDDLLAAQGRADSLSRELEEEKAGRKSDAARLARLERSLSAALQELANLRDGTKAASNAETAVHEGNRSCPDCARELRPVKLLDATAMSVGSKGGAHVELSYASPDSQPSFWIKAVPSEGTIAAMLCPGCGRTLLYAKPKNG